ncbi:MAG: GLUG motif-containing protein [Bradymonadaceae bacterium]
MRPDVGLADAGDTSEEGDGGGDAGADIGLDVTPGTNPCGGSGPLFYHGHVSSPGDTCGPCTNGSLVCNGPDALTCEGATEPNACGGCTAAEGTPGESCGTCGDGTYVCEGEMPVCEGDSDLNSCGGCAVLDAEPDEACDHEHGDGTWGCTSTEEITCIGPDENACGGDSALTDRPGHPCGTCGQGIFICDGEEAVVCQNEDTGVNSCGGCSPLLTEPETSCGLCGGEWTCSGTDSVFCDDPDRNVCGGCTDLGEGLPGDTCGDDEVYLCSSPENLVCADPNLNACGGTEVLEGEPGESCGACGDGRLVCGAPDQTFCVGASPPNICGGCEPLDNSPGQPCEDENFWQCHVDGTLVCGEGPADNACGGADTLDDAPGDACGPCGADLIVCDGPNDTQCSGETHCPTLDFETLDADDVSATGATLHGTFNALGLPLPEDHGFCWGVDPDPDTDCTELGQPDQAGAFEADLTGLAPGQTYHVRAFAVVDGTTIYADGVTFTTLAPPVTDVQATDGDHVAGVEVTWTGMTGATGYALYRDGVLVEQFGADVFSTFDTDADKAPLLAAPQNITATQGTILAHVEVSWDAVVPVDGTTHTYGVVALYPSATSTTEEDDGYAAAPPLEGYQISIDGGEWTNVSPALALRYEDSDAPIGALTIPSVSASQGTSTLHVELSTTAAAFDTTNTTQYLVRAFDIRDPGTTSEAATGYRGVGMIDQEWQRSLEDSDADYTDLGVTALTHDDATAPANGDGRYYRLALSAENGTQEFSAPARGYRAALAELEMISASATGPREISAWADITHLGAPNPTDHGVCRSTNVGLTDEVCVSLGAATELGAFEGLLGGLEPATTYWVRAYATTAAGTAYSNIITALTDSLIPHAVVFITQPSTTVAGEMMSDVEVEVVDAEGDRVLDANETITLSIEVGPAGSTLLGTTSIFTVDGVSTFDDLRIELAAVGYRLRATSGDLDADTSDTFDILAADPVEDTASISGTSRHIADGVDASVITIELFDTFGNPAIGVVPTFTASGDDNLYDACSPVNASGVSTCGLRSTTHGWKTLQLTSPFEIWGNTILFEVDSTCESAEGPFGGGTGVVGDPYTICAVTQLNAIGLNPAIWSAHFKLLSNVDMDGLLINVIGNDEDYFTGVFDGNYYTISNVFIEKSEENVALFSHNDGEIKNLGMVDVDITGSGRVGGLVGINYGSVLNSFSTGEVYSNGTVGGLVGRNEGLIENSYTSGAVTIIGNGIVGGVVGRNAAEGSIINSYAAAFVDGSGNPGGVAGANQGILLHSYWKVIDGSAGGDGTGLTAEQMADPNSYDPSWVFGPVPDHVWFIGAEGEPRLWWQ